MRMIRGLIVSLVLVAAVGCGENAAPVSGRVTLDDKPLVNATVIFFPESAAKNPGPGSQGKTDQNGNFTLKLMTKDVAGAIVGNHKVSITAYEGDDNTIPSSGSDMVFRKRLVPAKYNADTTLTFEVPAGGTKSADFELKSAP